MIFSFEDERIGSLSKVLGNKACKKILNYLAETKEASEKDISDAIKLPINTVEYNLKMLLDSGLIEKSKTFFWSKKGKKISMYKVSNKSIIISPKNSNPKIKTFIPAGLISLLGVFILRQVLFAKEKIVSVAGPVLEYSNDFADTAGLIMAKSNEIPTLIPITNIWVWVLFGVIFTAIVFIILSWRNLK